MGLSQVALRRGDKAAAESYMKQAVTLAPSNAAIQTSWGTYLYTQGQVPDAAAALRKAVDIDPQSAIAHLQLGDIYLVAFRKPDDAIREYKEALRSAPALAGGHNALGLALMSTDDLNGAERELLEAVKLAPGNALAHYAVGRLYSHQKRNDQALAAFAKAVKASPNFPAPHLEMGQILGAQGDDKRALDEFALAQKYDPKRPFGYLNAGMLQQQRKHWREAEAAYLSALKVSPDSAIAYNNLAWMAAEQKTNLSQALTWAQKAVSLGPNVPEFQGTLAWVYRAQGDLAKAEQALRAAAALKPQRAAVVYNLGRVYLEQGKKTQAAAEIKRALAIDPNFVDAGDARRQLKELGQS
jgi:tetratricopeptide (TPR) repeat protein